MLTIRNVSQRAVEQITRVVPTQRTMNIHILSSRASPFSIISKRVTSPHQIIRIRPRTSKSQQRTFGSYRSFNPSPDQVVLGLIGVNASITMLWMTAESAQARRRLVEHFTTSSGHLAHHKYYTLLTNVFSHADPMHLLTNMIGLYFFGGEISRLLGPKRFLGLYLASGFLSSWAAVKEQELSRRHSLNYGASGAVNAVTTLSILLFPNATLLFFGIVPVPAWIAGSMFIGRDLYGWLKGQTSGIGHVAHLGGAACGGLYYVYLRRMMRMRRY